MTENERIKAVRQALGITQDEFCEKLGIGRSALSQIEVGRTNASEQTIMLICREYRVREEWLRFEQGEMFIKQDTASLLGQFFGEIANDDDGSIRKRLIIALAKLEPKDWAAIADMAERITKDPE